MVLSSRKQHWTKVEKLFSTSLTIIFKNIFFMAMKKKRSKIVKYHYYFLAVHWPAAKRGGPLASIEEQVLLCRQPFWKFLCPFQQLVLAGDTSAADIKPRIHLEFQFRIFKLWNHLKQFVTEHCFFKQRQFWQGHLKRLVFYFQSQFVICWRP